MAFKFKGFDENLVPESLKEAFPEQKICHIMQSRLDDNGVTVKDFMNRLVENNIIPPEILFRGTSSALVYVNALGGAWIATKIGEYFPCGEKI